MPIVRKSVADARRAEAAATKQVAIDAASAAANPVQSAEESRPPAKPKKAKRPKKQPTGDYPVGYCRAPEETKFTKGCRPGPGRGKGNKSHDTIVMAALKERRTVVIDGQRVKLSTRELLVKTQVKEAFTGKGPHLAALLVEDSRLFPDTSRKQHAEDESANDNDILALFAQLAGGKAFTAAPIMKIGSDEIVDDPDWDEGEEGGDAAVA